MSARGFMTSPMRRSWKARAWLTNSPVAAVGGSGAAGSTAPGPRRKRLSRAWKPPALGAASLLRGSGSFMVSFTGPRGIRLVRIWDSQSGQHDAFEAFHGLGLVIADVIVS